MCIVSAIHDGFRTGKFPDPQEWRWPPSFPVLPQVVPPYQEWTKETWDDYQRLLKEARKRDEELRYPDCEDPKKAEFEKFIEEYLKKKGIL